jgi:hypothetical protein
MLLELLEQQTLVVVEVVAQLMLLQLELVEPVVQE